MELYTACCHPYEVSDFGLFGRRAEVEVLMVSLEDDGSHD